MEQRLAAAVAILMLAVPALAGIGAEHQISSGSSSLEWAVAFDGTNYVVVYSDSERLRVQRIGEDGIAIGEPFVFPDVLRPSTLRVASAPDGYSLVLWSTRESWSVPPALHGAIIPPQGAPEPPFTIAPAWNWPSVVAVGDAFLVAWSANDGTFVAQVDRSSSVALPQKVADRTGYVESFAAAGSDVILVWDDLEWSPNCAIPEGCPYPVPYIIRLTADGKPLGGREVWPQESGAPFDPTAGDFFVIDPYTVLRRIDGVWQRWTLSNTTSLAKTTAGLYAMVRRRYDDPAQLYLAPIGADGGHGAAYRLPVIPGYWYAAVVAGRTSMLALYSTATTVLSYRSVDLTTPFPPLPLGPTTASATLALSPKPYPNPWFQVNVQWTPVPAVDQYLVEAQPRSDWTARPYSIFVDSKTTTATFDQLQADIDYAFRVYGSSGNGLSVPAEADLRSPADNTVRAPLDVTVSTDGTTATFRWRDVSSNESGFRIRTCYGYAKCVTVAEVSADTTTATVRLLPGTYWYTVAAFNATDSHDGFPGYLLSAPVRLRAARH